MASPHPGNARTIPLLLQSAAFAAILVLSGCASPGPPRAPTLNLPEPVRDLSVLRIGNTVELHFTAPSRTTDKLAIRRGTVTGVLCRQTEHPSCEQLPSLRAAVNTVGPNGTHNQITWVDNLPEDLAQGPPRLLSYRVEFFSPTGRSAGMSTPAFTTAGTAPAAVADLHAEGSRLGVVLQWTAAAQPGDVVLKREDLAPASSKTHRTQGLSNISSSPIVWLGTNDPNERRAPVSQTLDTTALPGTPYRYTAQRRVTLQVGGHSLELRSVASTPIPFTLHELYPPLAPMGLSAVGFFTAPPPRTSGSHFAVDLIWQPVDDTGLLAGLAGYNVYREQLSTTGTPAGDRMRLTATPAPTPAFHDTTARPSTTYRYSVTAVDAKGNESPAVTVLLQPTTAQ